MGKRYHRTPGKKWIQRALVKRKKGSLRRQLHVPRGEKIPFPLLRRAAKSGRSRLLRLRARLALTLRRFSRKRR